MTDVIQRQQAKHAALPMIVLAVAGISAAGLWALSMQWGEADRSGSNVTRVPVIAVVLSYSGGYEWQNQIVRGIEDSLAGRAELSYHEMRTLGVQSEEELRDRGQRALNWIHEIGADALIVADDNAMRFVAEEGREVLSIPIVFCGVNWPADSYDLPREGVSGMVEVSPVSTVLEQLRDALPQGSTLALLGADRATDRAEAQGFRDSVRELGFVSDVRLVTTFDQWKAAYVE